MGAIRKELVKRRAAAQRDMETEMAPVPQFRERTWVGDIPAKMRRQKCIWAEDVG